MAKIGHADKPVVWTTVFAPESSMKRLPRLCLTVGAAALLLAAPPLAAKPVCAVEAADPPFDAARAWDEARGELATNYAYWDRIPSAAIDAAAPALRTAPDRLTFADRLQTLLLLFRDSHLHVSPTPAPQAAWVPSAADFWLEERGGHLLVRDVKGGSEAARLGLRPGWELLTMDGIEPRAAATARFAALGLHADAAQVLYAVNSMASGKLDQPRRFVFRLAGKRRELTLPPGYASVKRPEGMLTVTTLHDSAGHPVIALRPNNTLGDNRLIAAFDAAVAALPGDAHVTIDMRDTPSGGNSTVARAMLSHFVSRPLPYQRHELTAERVQFGVSRTWTEFVEPRAPYHGGQIVVLGGLWTGSMGEGIVIGYDAVGQGNTVVIGSEMGHLLGAMIDDELPASCLKVSFANEKLWHVDGTPREQFVPRIALPGADTAPDGSDPAMRQALALFDQWDSQGK
ncbi:MAG: hypothetical protein KGL44_03615 [Sphingomonadales bacterium]|nr:hypothetical protein [Sphingomonadales bacterium]